MYWSITASIKLFFIRNISSSATTPSTKLTFVPFTGTVHEPLAWVKCTNEKSYDDKGNNTINVLVGIHGRKRTLRTILSCFARENNLVRWVFQLRSMSHCIRVTISNSKQTQLHLMHSSTYLTSR